MSQLIDNLLKIDPVQVAEDIAGSRTGDDVVALAHLLQMNKNEQVAAALKEIGDVNSWYQTLDEYINILQSAGFNQIFVEDIPTTQDKLYMFWRDGVLIVFDSYSGNTTVNGGTAYLNYQSTKSDTNSSYWEPLSGCSHGPVRSEPEDSPIRTLRVSVDCRQALLHRLNKMNSSGTILQKWVEQPFLWLLNYMDSKSDGYDYAAINKQRLSQLPIEVQEAIGPYKK